MLQFILCVSVRYGQNSPKRFNTVCVPITMTCKDLDLHTGDRLVGLVVQASASGAEDPGFESRLRRDFFGVESYQ